MKNKWILYVTGFFSGMSVMAIELGASRLLAPYFSSSQIVWTIVIGTIMVAMALGNVLGGKMADKNKNPDKLFILLAFAAIWTGLIPFLGRYIIAGVALLLALFVTTDYLMWAALVSCLLVFVFPLMILGMVTPNLVRFAVNGVNDSGKTVGIIEALNTIGSIIGTFLPTFVTIPSVGTAWTFLIFALCLFAVCIIYWLFRFIHKEKSKRIPSKAIVKGAILVILSAVSITCGVYSNNISAAFWESKVLYEGESIYNYLRVEEDDRSIYLSTNVLFGVQSIKMKDQGLTGMYYDYALASPSMAEKDGESLNVLILGLGTGTFATQCQTYFTSSSISGVEIDQKIVDLAYKYFDLSDKVEVHVEDGRAFLSASKEKYDVIMVDAYQDITIPFQMSSVEFFTLVRDHLTAKGNMVVNMNMHSSSEGGINDYLEGTIKHVFASVYTVKASGTNIELFASDNYNVKDRLASSLSGISDTSLKYMMRKVSDNLTEVKANSLILTDDKAPVELLGMRVLDDLIADELSYYRGRLEGKSLPEIIQELLDGSLL